MNAKDTLQQFEEQLLTGATRRNPEKISLLLAEEFREFGSSGRMFSKAEIISHLQAEAAVDLQLFDFAAHPISGEAFLVTFRLVKQVAGLPAVASLRSSLWVYREGRWQMFFHQGTSIPPE